MAKNTSSIVCIILVGTLICSAVSGSPSFKISDDRFVIDGKPIQIISGSVHYHRIHPAYWEDRLLRVKSLGLNAIQLYVPWNVHEPNPGEYNWEGFADLEGFIRLADRLGLLVLVRPGPYICAEWDFGGFPWWFSSDRIPGGGVMDLRSADPVYLGHVERWWDTLLPKLAPLLYSRGGPIILVQIENEFGFARRSTYTQNQYMRSLIRMARNTLGDDVILYTTDQPWIAINGTLPGNEIFTAVDFGPKWWPLEEAFGDQKALNPPGKSPPFCSEFYTGWLNNFGQKMVNTSAQDLVEASVDILRYQNNSGSFNYYMVHGGTNFGFWAGAGIGDDGYGPIMTSYDYDAPISEAGDTGQPGIGGPNKFEMIRAAIQEHTGVEPPARLPRPAIQKYGCVQLSEQVTLLEELESLYSGDGIFSEEPLIMENYGQRAGFLVYRTLVTLEQLTEAPELEFSAPVHDYAQILLEGQVVGEIDRNEFARRDGKASLKFSLPRIALLGAKSSDVQTLDIVVHAMGRPNGGPFDPKGLTGGILLNGEPLKGWHAFPLPLENTDSLQFKSSFARRRLASVGSQEKTKVVGRLQSLVAGPDPRVSGPTFFRGTLTINSTGLPRNGAYLPDSYMLVEGWTKGVAWVNGFNLGWYWPAAGPQMTQYVPGPILREGENEVLLLEVGAAPSHFSVVFDDVANFYGPDGLSAVSSPGPHLKLVQPNM